VGFVGTVDEALERFEVTSVPGSYRRLSNLTAPYAAGGAAVATPDGAGEVVRRPVANGFTQWGVLTRRTLETFVRNHLTLAILLGSPAMVVGMFAILFRPGALTSDPSLSSMVMIGFWVVFAAFFFGLTYGLLQICTERTIPLRAPRRPATPRAWRRR
jgi:hypothetical protein